MDADERKKVRTEFKQAVNMTAKALEKWLETNESQSVGQKQDGEDEATGHLMGRRIVELKAKTQAALDDEDYAAMKKVVGYVARHLKQGGPADEDKVEGSRWRQSLMNWGHDPLK